MEFIHTARPFEHSLQIFPLENKESEATFAHISRDRPRYSTLIISFPLRTSSFSFDWWEYPLSQTRLNHLSFTCGWLPGCFLFPHSSFPNISNSLLLWFILFLFSCKTNFRIPVEFNFYLQSFREDEDGKVELGKHSGHVKVLLHTEILFIQTSKSLSSQRRNKKYPPHSCLLLWKPKMTGIHKIIKKFLKKNFPKPYFSMQSD